MFIYYTFRALIETFESITDEVNNIDSRDHYTEFENRLIGQYNEIIQYTLPALEDQASYPDIDLILENLIVTRDNLIKTFGKIHSNVEVPTSFYKTIPICEDKKNIINIEDSDSDEYKPAIDEQTFQGNKEEKESVDTKNIKFSHDNKFEASDEILKHFLRKSIISTRNRK